MAIEWEHSFARALELEDARLDGEIERMMADPSYQSFNHRHHTSGADSEGAAGLLQPFIDGLGRDRLLIIESESFFAEPEMEFGRMIEFLDIAPTMPERFDRYNARPGDGLDPEAVEWLRSHYDSHDAALAALIGHPPFWRA